MGDAWRVKYDGACARCGTVLSTGSPAIWDRTTRTMHCIKCPTSQQPAAAREEPDGGPRVAGRSARAEHDRRAAKRDAAITDRWGPGLVAKVVRAVSSEPQSTRAWAIGAAGEEKLAAELAQVPGLRMLHDRRVPGTRGNIDHIVIGPAGVFVVDAKAHRGRIEVSDRGSFFRSDYRLTIGGRDCSAMADKMGWQVDAVRIALAGRNVDPMPPIIPVLCFLEVEWPLLRAPDSFRGVRLESHHSIKRLLTTPTVLDEPRRDALLAVVAEGLPQR